MCSFAGLNAHHAIFSVSLIAYTKATTVVKLLICVCLIVDSVKVIPRIAICRTSSAVD